MPFSQPKKLCNIYLTLGPNALSRTCQTYPRIETSIQSYRQHSLSSSCPEAVHLVLFDPDALKYEKKTSVKRTKITESAGSTRREDVTQERQIIQLFCRHLIIAHSPFIEDNLYALVQFMIFLQSLNYRVEENYPRVESLFTSLVKELTDGQIYQKRKAITTPARHHCKFSLLLVMLRFFTTTGRSRQYLLSSVGDTMQFFGLQDETLQAAMPENWQILDDEWRKLLNDSCLTAPHVLKNYFLYLFHHTTFGLKDLSHSLRTLYYYFIDFFYLKTLLSVQSVRAAPYRKKRFS
ncbi:Flagellar biosynthetic protein FliU [Sodalis glossinidius str. 'morsitans']|uniref:Flagellar biosynthetic protein FliU n=1 Tax=Sodalis glossinidius (strain morsitans) TaxID=343509 RepID=Q2NRD4_SODGM|nr:flagellin lysine-N-methylase [Sodalis glossinidius]BAE75291.1 hypothetical protein SG2016 [Sodalis glossinidius str. 'morsitans']CRL46295.1 Flagellar biosynthetic protein FliU [Sodalis glossinidius str. 'morsitans']